jgi:hypothetical protein
MDKNIIKISIAMPLGNGVKPETFTSFLAMIYNTPVEVHYNFQKFAYIHTVRNNLVKTAQENNCTHIMFIDNDMKFPPDGIMSLLKHDKDVVGVHYNMKSVPVMTTVRVNKGEIPIELPKELFKCYAVGTGFTLIKMSVFDKISKPYFFYEDDKGEDVFFCDKCKKAGIEIWCDPTIPIGHIGDYLY